MIFYSGDRISMDCTAVHCDHPNVYLFIGVLKSVSSESDSANGRSRSRFGIGFDIVHRFQSSRWLFDRVIYANDNFLNCLFEYEINI